ncbi:RraA family protein [Bacillus sp. FJAT-49705]|uniref:Putative 4-hydroxy-4-methyl-2-oxoglutarate aldolase n=1 Tax=Cytobacillus citreus TaxID=2833586 RepID=A0ABS5NWW2_9BACI|nr:RraA family protein [Cytobacillus citreus]MBS4192332.1 RraA family protein [Cytobacillus citreus]
MLKNNSKAYFDDLEKKLYTAVVNDVLDSLGYRNQTADPGIRPINSDKVLVGRAKTIQASEVNREPKEPYVKLIEALDSIEQGDIFIASTGASNRSGFYGELLATATSVAGGRGAIIDGLIRDARQLKKMGFPVFTRGFRPTDSYGRNEVIEYDVSISCGGVTVNPGDLIIADIDGIVVVPAALEAEVIEKALKKVSGENMVREELLKGVKISEVFKKYEIL